MNRFVSAGLAVVGVLVALFFVALLGIADCSATCRANGETAPVFIYIGVGLGLAAFGLAANKLGTRRSLGLGLLIAGLIATGGSANVARQYGMSGMTLLAIAIGVGSFGVGAFLLRPTSR